MSHATLLRRAARALLGPLVAVAAASVSPGVVAYDWKLGDANLNLSGYLRQYVSMNLQDPVEVPGDDTGDISMVRTQVRGDFKGTNVFKLPAGGVDIFMSVRLVGEQDTLYQDKLADIDKYAARYPTRPGLGTGNFQSGAYGYTSADGANGAGACCAGDYTDYYMYHQFPVRELYADVPLIKNRLNLRFGKQQIVWGETDFFQGTDLMHGFDYTWRSFLEPENEELRKPLIMANFQLQVPEANGSLQVVLRPGWDRADDIGTNFDIHGGRWSQSGQRGVDFSSVLNYNYHHPKGDVDDPTGGIRWQGIWGDINYSLLWLHNFTPDPVINSCSAGKPSDPANNICYWAPGGLADFLYGVLAPDPGVGLLRTATHTFGPEPTPSARQRSSVYRTFYLGDIIYPIVDTFGGTMSAYVPFLDAVFSAEAAYTIDKPFHTGGAEAVSSRAAFPGLSGIITKDILRTMFRLDYQARWTQKLPLIGTARPSFLSFQLFNTLILDYNKADDIVNVGHARHLKEYSPLLTTILSLPYHNDRFIVGLVGAFDMEDLGNGLFAPTAEWVIGDHFRLKAELDWFFNDGAKTNPSNGVRALPLTGPLPASTMPTGTFTEPLCRGNGCDASVFGFFEGSNQFMLRATYQF